MVKDDQVPDTPTTLNTCDTDDGNSPSTTREKLKSSNSSSDVSNAEEESDRNTSKKRRSSWGLTGLLQMHFPELEAEDAKTQSSKKWKRGRRGRQFSFASPEEYIAYASRRSLIQKESAERKEPEKKAEEKKEVKESEKKETEKKDRRDNPSKEPTRKTSKTNKNPSWSRNWKKYQSSRKFTFSSPEEFLEYSSELKKEKEYSSELKRAKKRNTTSTEFEALDATADVSLFRDSNDDASDDGDESVDIEANNLVRRDSFLNLPPEEKKSCFRRKLSIREVVQILGLWVMIAVVALLVAKERPGNEQDQKLETPMTTGPDSVTCSLCPSGSSVLQPELQIALGDFSCASVDLVSSSEYTCGEIEKLLNESSSECSENDSCPGFQEAVSQCCFSDAVVPDEIIDKQLAQSENAVGHLHSSGGN